jgi:hypothetical protein
VGKLNKNQSGFGAVEGILVLVIVILIGVVGYMVYHNHHKTTASVATTAATTKTKKVTTPTTTASNTYADWKSFCSTAGGGLCLKYPSNWTFNQSMSQSVVPESDVFTSPSGSVAVDYLPGEALGSDSTGTVVQEGSTNSTQASDLSTYGAIIQSSQSSSFTGYDAELFVGDNANETDTVGSQLPNPPEFSPKELFNGQETNVLDVVQSSTNNPIGGAQANFSTQAEAQAWLNSSEVKTAQLILESASYK